LYRRRAQIIAPRRVVERGAQGAPGFKSGGTLGAMGSAGLLPMIS